MQTVEMIAMDINKFTKTGKICFFCQKMKIGDTKGEIGSMYCFLFGTAFKTLGYNHKVINTLTMT